MPTTFTFLRHAETEANRSNILMGGRQDSPLTESGKESAAALASFLGSASFDAILCSPNSRTRDTLALALPDPACPVHIEERLREQDFGQMTGLAINDIPAEADRAFRADPYGYKHPEGESVYDVQQRVGLLIQDCITQHPGHNLFLVTHEHVIKAAVGYMKHLDKEVTALRFSNCSLTQYSHQEGIFSAVYVNRTVPL